MFEELGDYENFILEELVARILEARKKHPRFAEGVYEALGYLSEEHGEAVRAVTHCEGSERVDSELLDLMTVAFRILNREHER